MAYSYSSHALPRCLRQMTSSDDNNGQPVTPIPIETVKPTVLESYKSVLETLGYRLGPIVGEGTYSKVREVELTKHDTQTGKMAVKIINRKNASKDFVCKFLPREIKILTKINHPNIIKVHRILEIGDYIYIFMDLAVTDLLAYIQKTDQLLSLQEAKHFFRQIASAVKYLHDHNICHRDLKCENILIFPNKVIKLSDFGFAKNLYKKPDFKLQMSHTFCGSAAYAAPEILAGIPYEPQLCDVWSLGCILFILLSSCMPFDDSNLKLMLQQQLAREPKFPAGFEIKNGLQVKHLICSMLEPETRRRIHMRDILNHQWMTHDDHLPVPIHQCDEHSQALSNDFHKIKKVSKKS